MFKLVKAEKAMAIGLGLSCCGAAYSMWSGGEETRAKVFDGPEVEERLSVGWWDEKWAMGQTSWKRAEQDNARPWGKNLEAVASELGIPKTAVTRGTAFVPLCGDSGVVQYLAEQGMNVVCCEGADLAVAKLRESLKSCPKAVQDRITIIHGDYFGGLPEIESGSIDFIYDRGSLVAIDPSARGKYVSTINRIAKTGATCYLEGIMRSPIYVGPQRGAIPPSNRDHAPWVRPPNVEAGPPHHLPPSVVSPLYPGWTHKVQKESMDELLEKLSDATVPHASYRSALLRM